MSSITLAVTGDPRSGKSTVGEYLESRHDFIQFTGSDFLIEEARKEGIELVHRQDFSDFQRKLRIARGASFITDRLLALPDDRKVNVGIRNRLDVDRHKQAGGIIIALFCPIEERFNRRERNNPKYAIDFEDFLAEEADQYNDKDPFGQHTHYAMANAEHWIDTSKPLETTLAAVDEIISYHSGQQG